MMQLHDLDIKHLQDIPGYKAILKAVIKSQMQMLVEQLADHTGEESLLLTASVSDGTLCHLGSGTGKHFIDGRDEIKSQFLSFCLKRQEKRKPPESPTRIEPEPRIQEPRQRPSQVHQPHRSYSNQHRVHPVALTRAQPGGGNRYRSNASSDFHKRSFPSSSPIHEDSVTPTKQMRLPTETFPNPFGDAAPMSKPQSSPTHSTPSRSNSDSGNANIQQIDLSEEPRKVKLENTSVEESDNNFGSAVTPETSDQGGLEQSQGDSMHFQSNQTDTSQNIDPDLSNLISSIPSVSDGHSDNSRDMQSIVKVEPVTEGELELEITGVEMAAGSDSNNWNQQGFGADTSGADYNRSGGGNQSGIGQRKGETSTKTASTAVNQHQSHTPPTSDLQSMPSSEASRLTNQASENQDHGNQVQGSQNQGQGHKQQQGPGRSLSPLEFPSFDANAMYPSPIHSPSSPRMQQSPQSPMLSPQSSPLRFPRADGTGFLGIHNLGRSLGGTGLLTPYQGYSKLCCEFCGKVCKQKTHLDYHRKLHTGERPFKCDICGKGFIAKQTMQTHRRTHTGDKPFKCRKCGMAFCAQSGLSNHVKRCSSENLN